MVKTTRGDLESELDSGEEEIGINRYKNKTLTRNRKVNSIDKEFVLPTNEFKGANKNP